MDEKPGLSRKAKIAILCVLPFGLAFWYGLYQFVRYIFS